MKVRFVGRQIEAEPFLRCFYLKVANGLQSRIRGPKGLRKESIEASPSSQGKAQVLGSL